jgi:16S rRNA (uracil1498-N3)-methyltransferase
MRYFFIPPEALARSETEIVGREARHMGKVLRLKPGMVVGLSDGCGMQGEARIVSVTRDRVVLAVLRRFSSPRETTGELVAAQAMLKDQKMDLLLRQLTELGITGWRPFVSQRSIPQPDTHRQASRTERWERIAREAVKQCRRGRLPAVAPVGRFADILQVGERFDMRILFWEGARHALPALPAVDTVAPRKILMVVGPEGGFADEEARHARERGFRLAALGPRILRAETAAVAACTLVQHLYGDLRRVLGPDDTDGRHGGSSEPA